MHKASSIKLKTNIKIAHSLAQIKIRFMPIPIKTNKKFHTLAASLSQKLKIIIAKAKANKKNQI